MLFRIKCYFLIRQVVAGGVYLYYVGETGRRESACNYCSGVISSQNCVIITTCPCYELQQNSSCWLAPWLLESGFNQEWQTFNERGRLCFYKCLSSYWLAEWNTATSFFAPTMKVVLFTSLPSSVFVTHSSFFLFVFRIFMITICTKVWQI